MRCHLIDDPVDALVIRHVDRLRGDAVTRLTTALREARDRCGSPAPWVAVTMTDGLDTGTELAGLRGCFSRVVEVPPLRRHTEDLAELVPLFLRQLCHDSPPRCAPAAMHLLMRARWSGNTEQLYRVIKDIIRRRRSGTIHPADLPAAYRSVVRRPLNRFEEMERDAIVGSLEEAEGNKAHAARLLGVSRATIYRKIREYGIVIPSRSA